MPFHSALSWPCSPSNTRRTTLLVHFSARNLRACSRSIFWSSEKSKFMGFVLDGVAVAVHDRDLVGPRNTPSFFPRLRGKWRAKRVEGGPLRLIDATRR